MKHPKDDDIPRKEVCYHDFFVGWIDGDQLLDVPAQNWLIIPDIVTLNTWIVLNH